VSGQALPCHITLQWAVAPFLGLQSLWGWIFDAVLTIQIPDRPDPLWRSLLLLGDTHPTSELSW
jgi:hypothetical protein